MLRDPICGIPLGEEGTKYKAEVRGKTYYFCSDYCRHTYLEGSKVAYFSMEIGLRSDIPTYSGGLGVLAGDTIRSSADLRIPLVAVSLISRKGYLDQEITPEGQQVERPVVWDPSQHMNELKERVSVEIEGRQVYVRAWMYDHFSPTGGLVSILFLDTDLDENSPEDRSITDYLYGGDEGYRLKQEIVLGMGGVRMLKAAGFRVRKYHMNEGHSSLLTLELLSTNEMDPEKVRDLCVFTTHTPVEAGHDKFPYDMVQRIMGQVVPLEMMKKVGGEDKLNLTRLALNLSKYVNGVANRHRELSMKLFPGHHISAITNGVHSYTWTCRPMRMLFDKYLPGWANEPSLLVRIDSAPDEEIWEAHMAAKKELLDLVWEKTDLTMDQDVLTIGFARRITGYKRPDFLFSDVGRLKEVNSRSPIQIIFAGKAHPRDVQGKRIIQQLHDYIKMLKNDIQIAYLKGYDMDMAAKLVAGVDVWLNTPLPPYEASGTSGMKAAHNGVLNFSVLDGWWLEGWIEGVTGWAIGPPPDEGVPAEVRQKTEVDDLYNKLSYLIGPTFYGRRNEWIELMKNSISKIAYYFNSHRMMQRYVTEAYL